MKPGRLIIRNVHAGVDGQEILHGVDLSVKQGEVHAIMGPNGSGKSTLAHVLMGHPKYAVTQGSVTFRGKNVLRLAPEDRARLGLFLSFQYPMEVHGVPMTTFLRTAYNQTRRKKTDPISAVEFVKLMKEKARLLGLKEDFFRRNLNEGFSGGEKKRAEIFQMAVLQPSMAVLDETDSGLDIDALRIVSEGIQKLRGQELGVVLITHYQRILNYVKPDFVHVLAGGRIVASGDRRLALTLEKKGYGWLTKGSTA